LAEIERTIGRPIAQSVDLIAGTSTGGILALGLAKRGNGGKPEFSASDLADLYRSRGKEIFRRSLWQGVSSVGGVLDEQYPHDGLERVLEHYFGDQPLSDVTTRVMVATYDIQNREPFFFKSWRRDRNAVTMRDVARATSAAPTYFEPTVVRIGDAGRALIDGGVFANNPTMCAYAEIRRDSPSAEVKAISLGTGELIRPISYSEAKCWGRAQWMLPALSCIFDGVSDSVSYQMEQILGENFVRLQIDLKLGSDDMDDATDGNLANLTSDAKRLITTHKSDIETACAWLSK
jgi:hypothetical protein